MAATPASPPPIQQEKAFLSDHLLLKFEDELVRRGLLKREAIEELSARRALTNETLDRLIVKESVLPEPAVLSIMSELSRIPFRPMAELTVDQAAIAKVPARAAIRYNVMPIRLDGGVITLAACQVPDVMTADSLRMLLNMAVDWILCTSSDLSKSLKHFYGLGAEAVDAVIDQASSDLEFEGKDVSVETADEGVMKFLNQVIFEAIKMNSTDIHIEPFEETLRLRYRIDGILQEVPVPKGVERLRKSISSCVKIMADLNIAERRKPHDGRIKVRSGTDEFDLRVSILPTRYGETVAMRILNRKTMFYELGQLGLATSQLPAIEYLSSLPHGVILLTGPTGSGKTTTLYAILSRISTAEVKIITVEDPIEYQLQGISQIQVHSQIGLTFATVLRSILRHDPDIVLIGEIRDRETADIAVRASLTGHLVFSTLHTNDAASAVTRLIDMGVEPFLVSSCLEGSIAQRLVRRICPACRTEVAAETPILEEIRAAFPTRAGSAVFYRGHGCPDCNFTGYRGRIALFEIMVLNDALRSMIVRERPSNEIKNKAIEGGLVPLRNEGWSRVLEGVTSIDEVVRVARKTELAEGSDYEA